MPTAVVIDGAYFLRRFKHRYPELDQRSPHDLVLGIMWLAAAHVAIRSGIDPAALIDETDGKKVFDTTWTESTDLYRIFFYDCEPLTKRVHSPISKRSINLAQTPEALTRIALHQELLGVRKVALRLGRLSDQFGWRPKPGVVDTWLKTPTAFAPSDEDFEIDTIQKGVDMRLGLDVASMAFKRQVDQIVMIAADADFVPAVKLARREGIDVVLDPMGGQAAKDLIAHADGVRQHIRTDRT
jgi:uncharacterized LabA/DUF88 family protein